MKRVIVLVLALSALSFAKSKDLTEEQRLRLENAQLKLKLAYIPLQQGQVEFQQKMKDFDAECQAIVKANGMEAGTRCNPDNLEFVAPAKVETKK